MSFYIGQKVVCVNAKAKRFGSDYLTAPLKEGNIYTVEGKKITGCCGVLVIDVGLRADLSVFEHGAMETCLHCMRSKVATENIFWLEDWRFMPLEDYEAMNELVKELTEPKLQEA